MDDKEFRKRLKKMAKENGIEYEENRQNELRKIRLLDPRYIGQFVEEYETLMKESII